MIFNTADWGFLWGVGMPKIVKYLVKDIFSTEMLLYMLFGVGTAAIDYFTEIALYNHLAFNSHVATVVTANSISFVLSVTFAFFTNKHFVFKSRTVNSRELCEEAFKFFSTRLLSFIVSLIFMVLLVDRLYIDNNVSKIIVSVFVVIANYLFSKFVIFPTASDNERAETSVK